MRPALELFPGADFGTPRPSLAKARELVAEVERLPEGDPFAYADDCLRVALRAERLGAHSVARACRWLTHVENLQLADPTFNDDRAVEIALRWLSRQEAAALPRKVEP